MKQSINKMIFPTDQVLFADIAHSTHSNKEYIFNSFNYSRYRVCRFKLFLFYCHCNFNYVKATILSS